MNTYILNWYDEDLDEVCRIKINEAQKKLIDYLVFHFNLDEALDDYRVRISIEEETKEIIDLTK